MASVWFFVIAAISIQQTFAFDRDCKTFTNCNDCIRCGRYWCKDPKEVPRCMAERTDNWCSGNVEKLPFFDENTEAGSFFNLKYSESTILINSRPSSHVTFQAKSDEQKKVKYVVNSTQFFEPHFITVDTSCDQGNCKVTIDPTLTPQFCSADGSLNEYLTVMLSVPGVAEKAVLKYHVPCACGCSDEVVERSPICNRRGSYSCGVCTCQKDWQGTFCETPICKKKRGDVPCVDTTISHLECAGNGVCGACDECECYTNREGSRYFKKENYCADLCITTNDCDVCLTNPVPGQCQECSFPFYKRLYNQSYMSLRDDFNNKLWVKCNSTINDCNIEYAAMKEDNGDTFYMIINACDPISEEQVTGGVRLILPLVLGLIMAVAAVAAIAGYVFWKNRLPPMPPTDPMYQNIDAEDCRGENPLYKPPTSSFKNPTYGKWT